MPDDELSIHTATNGALRAFVRTYEGLEYRLERIAGTIHGRIAEDEAQGWANRRPGP